MTWLVLEGAVGLGATSPARLVEAGRLRTVLKPKKIVNRKANYFN